MIRQIDPGRGSSSRTDAKFLKSAAIDGALGAGLGLAAAAVMFAGNVDGLRDLILSSNAAVLTAALFFLGFAVLFGGAVCSTVLMSAPDDEDGGPDDGLLQPIPVRTRDGRRGPG